MTFDLSFVNSQIPWPGWFGGGLAGSALTLISQWFGRLWRRPRLEVLFKNEESGCCVDTNVIGGTEPVARYVRLRLRTPEDPRRLASRGAETQAFAEEVLDLMLSSQADATLAFLLAPGAHRFVDLARTQRDGRSHQYDFHWHPARLRLHGFGTRAGTYGAEVFAVAENAKAL